MTTPGGYRHRRSPETMRKVAQAVTAQLDRPRDPRLLPRPRRETEIQREILSYLSRRGIPAIRMNSRVVMVPGAGGRVRPMRMGGVKGMSDIIGILPKHLNGGGRFLALEVKRSDRIPPRPEQQGFLRWVEQAGGLAAIVSSPAEVHDLVERALGGEV